MHYDYLIVGAGITGATLARLLTDAGKKVLVIEQRLTIGGNCYTENRDDIIVHQYGPHIFHTSNETVYKFVKRFCKPMKYRHKVEAVNRNEFYSLPFTMHTFSKIFKTSDVEEVKQKIEAEIKAANIKEPKNLEEQAISLVGKTVYKLLVKDYTEKQWGRPCKELPPYIIKRLPLRFDWNDEYFNDKYQFIPKKGYTDMIANMLKGIDVILSMPYKKFISKYHDSFDRLIWTGRLDELFDFKLGHLAWRSLKFQTFVCRTNRLYTYPVTNYTDDRRYTRITEHKLFDKHCKNKKTTIVSYEYPIEFQEGDVPYYTVNTYDNELLAEQYRELAKKRNIVLAGRLATYRYLDMHVAIEEAMRLANDLLKD